MLAVQSEGALCAATLLRCCADGNVVLTSINPGAQVGTPAEALQVLVAEPEGARAHGVMIGRASWKRPWDCFSDADRAVFGAEANAAANRRQVAATQRTMHNAEHRTMHSIARCSADDCRHHGG